MNLENFHSKDNQRVSKKHAEKTIASCSPEETLAAGRMLGLLLKAGDIVALQGGLGVGKTIFAKGVAAALQIYEPVTSPTYTIINEYEGICGGKNIIFYHIDAYRLAGVEDFLGAGGSDAIFANGISVVEWSERLSGILPVETIIIKINIVNGGLREITYL